MADWEKLNEASLPEKEDFYIDLNVEDITDADYAHIKRVSKRFKKKQIMRRSWFACAKRYIIISWCIWELSRDFEIYELDPANFFSPGLESEVALEKTKVKLDYSTDINV